MGHAHLGPAYWRELKHRLVDRMFGGAVAKAGLWRWILLATLLVLAAAILVLGPGEIWATLDRLNLWLAATGTAALAVAQVAFAARWWTMLGVGRPSFCTTLSYVLIGGLLNVLLPMRAGDLTRAVLLSRGHGIRLGDAAGTVAAERLTDAATVALLGLWLASQLVLPDGVIEAVASFVIVVIVTSVAAFVASRRSLLDSLKAFVLRMPGRIGRRLADGLGGVALASARLTKPRTLLVAATFHSIGWLGVAAALAAFLASLDVAVPKAAVSVAILVLTSVGGIVLQVPAGVGAWHMLAAAALALWHVPLEAGLAFAIVAHAISIAVPIVGGTVAALRLGGVRRIMQLGRATVSGVPADTSFEKDQPAL